MSKHIDFRAGGVALAILCSTATTSHAEAEAPTLQQQYEAAAAAFMGDIFTENLMDFAVVYPEHIFDGIEGQWLPLWAFGGPDSAPGGGVAATCAKQHDTIKIENRLQFSVLEREGAGSPRSVIYQSLGGSKFQTWVDSETFLPVFNATLDGNRNDTAYAYKLLDGYINEVSIFRPSSDILTIVRGSMTEIWGRCPA